MQTRRQLQSPLACTKGVIFPSTLGYRPDLTGQVVCVGRIAGVFTVSLSMSNHSWRYSAEMSHQCIIVANAHRLRCEYPASVLVDNCISWRVMLRRPYNDLLSECW